MNAPAPAALTRAQAAERYGVSKATITRAIAAGDLKAKRYGRRYLVSLDALEDWFAALPDALPDA